MKNGVCIVGYEGSPQGGPLSPLLANLLLDELDEELKKRGQRFCRYADDSDVYVYSRAAGERVMASITRFMEKKLRFRVNQEKSKVAYVSEVNSSATTSYRAGDWRIHRRGVKHMKLRVKPIHAATGESVWQE